MPEPPEFSFAALPFGKAGFLSRIFSLPAFFDSRCAACGDPVERNSLAGRLCPGCAKDLAPMQFGFCKLCGLPFAEGSVGLGPCQACLARKPVWEEIYFIGPYQGLLRDLLLGLKFHSALSASSLLGEMMALRVIEKAARKYDMVVPVPLHVRRLRERGYNQSLELARPLAKVLGLPLETSLLARTRYGLPQRQLSRGERAKAVKGAFLVEGQLNGGKVLLVDDVMTTGATVTECAKRLFDSGAGAVDVVLAARTPLD